MTTLTPQDISTAGGFGGKIASLIQSGFTLGQSIENLINASGDPTTSRDSLKASRDRRLTLGLVDIGSTRDGKNPLGTDGDLPVPGLAKFLYLPGNHKNNHKLAKDITDGKFTNYLLDSVPLKYPQLVQARQEHYGNNPVMLIRKELVRRGDIPAYYSAENIRNIINPSIGIGKPKLPVGWNAIVAVRQGFANEIRVAMGRLHTSDLATRGADLQDRKILALRVKNAALLAHESGRVEDAVRRIEGNLPVGIGRPP